MRVIVATANKKSIEMRAGFSGKQLRLDSVISGIFEAASQARLYAAA